MKPPQRVQLLGVEVELLTLEELQRWVVYGIQQRRPYVIANHNLHSVYLYHHDPLLRAFFAEVDRIHIDGMPLVWMARLLGYPARPEHRVTYADWVHPLMALASERGFRVFHLGGKPGVWEKAARRLRTIYPSLKLLGHHGYFDMDGPENRHVLEKIWNAHPQILMVGMGMPRQEHWIYRNRTHLPPAVVLPSGACLDYVAGVVPTPPRWSGRWGLEWFFRFLAEPGRLWHRYWVEPVALLPWVVRDMLRRMIQR